MAKIVALLDSMWGWAGHNIPGAEAPRFFKINPRNFSGQRLYKLVGNQHLVVTNCCSVVQATANHHGEPDLEWTRDNLCMALPFDLLLVCGRVAKETFEKVREPKPPYQIMWIDHPAARRWTKEMLIETAERIDRTCRG